MTTPIPVPPIGPIVFVLDRTASMATRDCPDGASRWEFAVNTLRATLIDMMMRDPSQPVMLLTCGTTVTRVLGVALNAFFDMAIGKTPTNGDASFAIGQAALEAAWHAGEGHVVIIADGPSAQDTDVGKLVLGNDVAMGALFSRTYFLTVGKADAELAAFAGKWPHSDSLEAVLAYAQEFADTQGASDDAPSAPIRVDTLSDGVSRLEHFETAPTEPPPDLQADGSVPLVKSSKAPKRR